MRISRFKKLLVRLNLFGTFYSLLGVDYLTIQSIEVTSTLPGQYIGRTACIFELDYYSMDHDMYL